MTAKFTERGLQELPIAQLLDRLDLAVRLNLYTSFLAFGEQRPENLIRRLVAKQLSECLLAVGDSVRLNLSNGVPLVV